MSLCSCLPFTCQVKMSRMRQRIAERLKEAQNVNAMLTTFNEVDMRYAWQHSQYVRSSRSSQISSVSSFLHLSSQFGFKVNTDLIECVLSVLRLNGILLGVRLYTSCIVTVC